MIKVDGGRHKERDGKSEWNKCSKEDTKQRYK